MTPVGGAMTAMLAAYALYLLVRIVWEEWRV